MKDIAGNIVTVPTVGIAAPQVDYNASDNAVGLILNNGTLMSIIYNPKCTDNSNDYIATDADAQNHICANIVFDTNGFKKPNQVGKDIGFASVINPVNTVVVVVVVGVIPDIANISSSGWALASSNCLSKGDTWHLPTRDELSSIYYNKTIIGNLLTDYWSSNEYTPDPTYAWHQHMSNGHQDYYTKIQSIYVRCVKR